WSQPSALETFPATTAVRTPMTREEWMYGRLWASDRSPCRRFRTMERSHRRIFGRSGAGERPSVWNAPAPPRHQPGPRSASVESVRRTRGRRETDRASARGKHEDVSASAGCGSNTSWGLRRRVRSDDPEALRAAGSGRRELRLQLFGVRPDYRFVEP